MRGSLLALIERHPALPRVLPFALLLAGIAFDGLYAGRSAALPWDLRWDYAARNLCALIALLLLLPALPEIWRVPRLAIPSGARAALEGETSAGAGVAAGTGGAAGADIPATDWLLAIGVGVAVLAMWIAPPLRAFSQAAGGLDLQWLGAGLHAALVADSGGSGFKPLDAAGQVQWSLAAMRLAGSALVVPVVEELFWRSFAMRWLDGKEFQARDPRRVGLRALLLQALVFGLEHELWLAGILAGLAYGWLYRRGGRLWPVIVAHGVTNALLGAWVLATGQWFYW